MRLWLASHLEIESRGDGDRVCQTQKPPAPQPPASMPTPPNPGLQDLGPGEADLTLSSVPPSQGPEAESRQRNTAPPPAREAGNVGGPVGVVSQVLRSHRKCLHKDIPEQ